MAALLGEGSPIALWPEARNTGSADCGRRACDQGGE